MADQKLSDLASASTVGSADLLYVVQGGVSKKAAVSSLVSSIAVLVSSSYATIAYVTDALIPYATKASVTAALTSYTTNANLTSTLSLYATDIELAAAITTSNAALTATLLSYTTNANLTATLLSYTTNANLTSTLASYTTNANLTSTLASYTLNANLTSTLASYTTNDNLTSTLASYTTNANLTSSLASTTSLTLNILKIDDGVHEKFQDKTSSTGTVTHDCSLGHVFYHTSSVSNWTANFTNLSLSSSYATTVTLVIPQGGTGYYPNAVQIGGAAQTILWQGNTTPTPSTNRTDVVTFSILNNSGTYIVLGQLTGF
jgi:hypothetical protein